MKIKPIKNEDDYQKALERLEKIFDASPGTEKGDELEILTLLIDSYENKNFPIEIPDPIEAIKFQMEQLGMKHKDLAATIGFKSRVSEILNKKKKTYFRDDQNTTRRIKYSDKHFDKGILRAHELKAFNRLARFSLPV